MNALPAEVPSSAEQFQQSKLERPARLKPQPQFVIGLILTLLMARIAFAASLELFQDEALYVWQARQTDTLFMGPHPPGSPLLAKWGLVLFGSSPSTASADPPRIVTAEFAVRFFNIVISTLTFIAFYWFARIITNARAAVFALLAFAAVPMYFGFGSVATPDAPQLLFWTLALLFTWRGVDSGRWIYWILAGLAVGAGLCFKYIMVLYFPSLVIALAALREQRRKLLSPGPWIAFIVAAAVFAPVLLQQGKLTDWSAFRYHLQERQSLELSDVENVAGYIALHIVYYSPVIFLWSIAGIWWAWKRGRKLHDPRLIFLFAFSAVPALFFLVVALLTKRQLSREQWDAPAYVSALVAGAWLARQWFAQPGDELCHKRRRGLLISAPLVGLIIIAILAVEARGGPLTRALNVSPVFSKVFGWKRLARVVDRHVRQLPAGTPVILLASSFDIAFEYAFYGSYDLPLRVMDSSTNDRYGIQSLLEQKQMSQWQLQFEKGSNAVYAGEEDVKRPKPEKVAQRRAKLDRWFERIDAEEAVEVRRVGRIVRRFRIYRLINLEET